MRPSGVSARLEVALFFNGVIGTAPAVSGAYSTQAPADLKNRVAGTHDALFVYEAIKNLYLCPFR